MNPARSRRSARTPSNPVRPQVVKEPARSRAAHCGGPDSRIVGHELSFPSAARLRPEGPARRSPEGELRPEIALVLLAAALAEAAPVETYVLEPAAIRVFADEADGDVPPLRTIEGSATDLGGATALALDLAHRELFAASGTTAPARAIAGAKTLLDDPVALAGDRAIRCSEGFAFSACLFRDGFEDGDPGRWSASAGG